MPHPDPFTLTLDRRLLEHPQAYHLKRMRGAIWLYLDLLARGAGTIEIEPAAVGGAMGLPEGTVRSWLGHLRKAGYLEAERLNGKVRVTIERRTQEKPAPGAQPPEPAKPARFFTAAKIIRALGERKDPDAIEGALAAHSDAVIRRALAGAMATPSEKIRRSRTALFLYLLNRYAQEA
jgi:hypothetical protein